MRIITYSEIAQPYDINEVHQYAEAYVTCETLKYEYENIVSVAFRYSEASTATVSIIKALLKFLTKFFGSFYVKAFVAIIALIGILRKGNKTKTVISCGGGGGGGSSSTTTLISSDGKEEKVKVPAMVHVNGKEMEVMSALASKGFKMDFPISDKNHVRAVEDFMNMTEEMTFEEMSRFINTRARLYDKEVTDERVKKLKDYYSRFIRKLSEEDAKLLVANPSDCKMIANILVENMCVVDTSGSIVVAKKYAGRLIAATIKDVITKHAAITTGMDMIDVKAAIPTIGTVEEIKNGIKTIEEEFGADKERGDLGNHNKFLTVILDGFNADSSEEVIAKMNEARKNVSKIVINTSPTLGLKHEENRSIDETDIIRQATEISTKLDSAKLNDKVKSVTPIVMEVDGGYRIMYKSGNLVDTSNIFTQIIGERDLGEFQKECEEIKKSAEKAAKALDFDGGLIDLTIKQNEYMLDAKKTLGQLMSSSFKTISQVLTTVQKVTALHLQIIKNSTKVAKVSNAVLEHVQVVLGEIIYNIIKSHAEDMKSKNVENK